MCVCVCVFWQQQDDLGEWLYCYDWCIFSSAIQFWRDCCSHLSSWLVFWHCFFFPKTFVSCKTTTVGQSWVIHFTSKPRTMPLRWLLAMYENDFNNQITSSIHPSPECQFSLLLKWLFVKSWSKVTDLYVISLPASQRANVCLGHVQHTKCGGQ